MTRRAASAIWPTVAASLLAYAQVISFRALALFVIGGSLVVGFGVTALCRAHRRLLGIVAMVVLTLACTWLASALAGSVSGPAVRATLMASGVTGAMALMAHTRYPLAIIPASLLMLAGALGLGAVEDGLWLTVAWIPAALITVVMLGPYGVEQLRDAGRWIPPAVMVVIVALSAVVTFIAVSPVMTDPWTIDGGGGFVLNPEATPSPLGDINWSLPSSASDAGTSALAAMALVALLAIVALLVLLGLLVLVLVIWRAWVALLWRRLRQRLDSRSPRQRAIGAWTWLRMRRLRHDVPLPVSVSPDVALTWARDAGEADVLAVAQVVAAVAFDDALYVSEGDAARAWAAALSGGRLPRGSLRQRCRWALRAPRWVDQRMPIGSQTQKKAATG